MWNFKRNEINELTKETHRLREGIYSCQGGRMGDRDKLGVQDGHVHTVAFKMDSNKDVQYSTGKSAQ